MLFLISFNWPALKKQLFALNALPSAANWQERNEGKNKPHFIICRHFKVGEASAEKLKTVQNARKKSVFFRLCTTTRILDDTEQTRPYLEIIARLTHRVPYVVVVDVVLCITQKKRLFIRIIEKTLNQKICTLMSTQEESCCAGKWVLM